MDLRMKQKLDTVTIFDLMNNSFYILDYQRGYRWTRLEVEKLLGDLEDFYNVNTDGSTFYCMQPLVVFLTENYIKKIPILEVMILFLMNSWIPVRKSRNQTA